jgi:hypothetical protein
MSDPRTEAAEEYRRERESSERAGKANGAHPYGKHNGKSKDAPEVLDDLGPPQEPPHVEEEQAIIAATINDNEAPLFADAPIFDPWECYIVPPFPLSILPGDVAAFVQVQSRNIGCDPSALAWSSLVNFSASIDHRFSMKMKRHGSFAARPRLWVMLVGDVSSKKTPSQLAAISELEKEENRLRDEYENILAGHEAAGGDKKDAPKPPARFMMRDTTIEKVADVLSRQARGILMWRDELSGWIGSMEKYSGGRGSSADRAFWLKSFDGGSHTVDRISRGEQRVKNMSVSFLGGIQPERLAALGDLADDGLLQRFIPIIVGSSHFGEDNPVGRESIAYEQLTRACLQLQPTRLTMTEEAMRVMDGLRRYLDDMEKSTKGVSSGLPGFIGKLAGLAGSLAIILHLIENPIVNASEEVQVDTIANVERLIKEFILPHAFIFYRTAEDATGGEKLRRLASWLLTKERKRFVASDLTTGVAGFRGLSLADINERLSPMVAGGWITPEKITPSAFSWIVNPAIYEQFKERAAKEARRKEELAKLMNAPQSKAP